MKRLEHCQVYQSARRGFAPATILFDDRVQSVSPSEKGGGRYVVPGFIDIHMHIESSMTTPTEFSRVTLPHGTTTIVADCHEVTNVFGIEGLGQFMGLEVLNDTFYAVPSSVPATSSLLETCGGTIDGPEVRRLAKDRRIICLGEVMNAHDLLAGGDNRTKRIIQVFRESRPECPIEGHCPRLSGSALDRFIASGVDSDHCQQTPSSIRERVEKGMFLEIQYKSLTRENIDALKEFPGFFSFVTDDVMPDTLMGEGQLDRVLRKAIRLGMRPEDVIYAATWAPAVRMHLVDRGMIAPGKLADFVVLDDLDSLSIAQVYKRGKLVYDRDAELVPHVTLPSFGSGILQSVRRDLVRADDFVLRIPNGSHQVVHVDHEAPGTLTRKTIRTVTVTDGTYHAPDVSILASVERYGHQAPVVPVPMLHGLSKPGAICSSWSHDSHNLLVMASDAKFAALAVNLVIKRQGGIATVDPEGEQFVPLAYGGIVSLEPMERLGKEILQVRAWLRDHGYQADDEVMSFAVLALPVSPVVKVSDKGIVDVATGTLIDWRDAE